MTEQIDASPERQAEQADSLSMAFLVLLESLSPVERAVFLLHDIFDYGCGEIANIVGKTEANCRQLAARARQHVSARRPRFETSRVQRERLAARFFDAVDDGDLDGLVGMLAAEVTVYGDSGGVPPSWPRPIVGRDKVSRLVVGLGQQVRKMGISIRRTAINGQPGALFLDSAGRVANVWVLDIIDGEILTIRSIINPDKLGHLGPLADLSELRDRRQGS